MMTNDCIDSAKYALTQRGAGSIRPCGCVQAARWGSVKEGEVYEPFSFLVMVDGILQPWTAADELPVAVIQTGFDTSAETAPVSKGVYYMAGGVKVQTDALSLPAGIPESTAKTILRAMGAELLDLTGAPI